MDHLKLTEDKLELETISDLVASPDCGAVSIFMGTTRDSFEGKNVVQLEYESYEAMALKAMKSICENVRNQVPSIVNLAIYHRLGTVPVKEASIIIAASSPHRAEAMLATQLCIDDVKRNVPIWKKEVYTENSSEWKENKESIFPPKLKKFKLHTQQAVKMPPVAAHLVQIKAQNEEIEERISKYMERKRNEINLANVRDFCQRNINNLDDLKESCARVDSMLIKRKDSKGHLQVDRVLNNYSRDQNDSKYLLQHMPKNGIEERLENLESQLSLTKPTNINIYRRLKQIEDRLLHLESISPEYIQFWNKAHLPKSKNIKKIFSINELDSIIHDLEKKKNQEKNT